MEDADLESMFFLVPGSWFQDMGSGWMCVKCSCIVYSEEEVQEHARKEHNVRLTVTKEGNASKDPTYDEKEKSCTIQSRKETILEKLPDKPDVSDQRIPQLVYEESCGQNDVAFEVKTVENCSLSIPPEYSDSDEEVKPRRIGRNTSELLYSSESSDLEIDTKCSPPASTCAPVYRCTGQTKSNSSKMVINTPAAKSEYCEEDVKLSEDEKRKEDGKSQEEYFESLNANTEVKMENVIPNLEPEPSKYTNHPEFGHKEENENTRPSTKDSAEDFANIDDLLDDVEEDKETMGYAMVKVKIENIRPNLEPEPSKYTNHPELRHKEEDENTKPSTKDSAEDFANIDELLDDAEEDKETIDDALVEDVKMESSVSFNERDDGFDNNLSLVIIPKEDEDEGSSDSSDSDGNSSSSCFHDVNKREEETIKEVEAIHDMHLGIEGEVWYFIKWRGLSSIMNTWEERCDLYLDSDIMETFNSIQKKWGKNSKSSMKQRVEKVLQIGKKEGVELYKVSMSGWPFDLWEPLDQIENEKNGKEAVKEFKEEQKQREARKKRNRKRRAQQIHKTKNVYEEIFYTKKYLKISNFDDKRRLHPLTFHLSTLTVGKETRIYEISVVNMLSQSKNSLQEAFHFVAKYPDMIMGEKRKLLQKASGIGRSDFKGVIGNNWMASQCKRKEQEMMDDLYHWLQQNVREAKPLWIAVDEFSMSLLGKKFAKYRRENEDLSWVIRGFTFWKKIQKCLDMRKDDGMRDDRVLRFYQKDEERHEPMTLQAKDVACNYAITLRRVVTKYLRQQLENDWKMFANKACLEREELRSFREHKNYHSKIQLHDCYHGTDRIWTWGELETMKKRVQRPGGDLLPEELVGRRQKDVPQGQWKVINEANHTICPISNCSDMVHRITVLGKHMRNEHNIYNPQPRKCQINKCQKVVDLSDLSNHANEHALGEYPVFWVMDIVEITVNCPQCAHIKKLQRTEVVQHMQKIHHWRDTREATCWLCESTVPLFKLKQHLDSEAYKLHFLNT